MFPDTNEFLEDLERLLFAPKFKMRQLHAVLRYVTEGCKYRSYLKGCENAKPNLRGAQLRLVAKLRRETQLQGLQFSLARDELAIAFMGVEEELVTACRLSRPTEELKLGI